MNATLHRILWGPPKPLTTQEREHIDHFAQLKESWLADRREHHDQRN